MSLVLFRVFFRITLQHVFLEISSVPLVLHKNTGGMHCIKSSILTLCYSLGYLYLVSSHFLVFLSGLLPVITGNWQGLGTC